MEESKWVKTAEVMKRFGISRKTVLTMIKRKQLRSLRLGYQFFVLREDVDKLEQKSKDMEEPKPKLPPQPEPVRWWSH